MAYKDKILDSIAGRRLGYNSDRQLISEGKVVARYNAEGTGLEGSAGETILFGGQTLSTQTSTTLAILAAQIGLNLLYTGVGAGAWTITGGTTVGSTFGCYVENRGADGCNFLTITPTSGTINGKASFSLPYGVAANIYGDGSSDLKASYQAALKDPTALLQSSLPLVIPSSATNISAGGLLTGTTAAFTLDANTSCYLYTPANSIFTGNAAGWYYAVITGANAATIYTDTWNGSGLPTIPTAPAAITTGLNAAFTQGTNLTLDVYKLSIPANYIRSGSRLGLYLGEQHTNSAGTKGWNWLVGAGLIAQNTNTTNAMSSNYAETMNVEGTKQIGQVPTFSSPFTGGGTLSFYNTAINFAVANDFKLQLVSSAAADMVCLRGFRANAYL